MMQTPNEIRCAMYTRGKKPLLFDIFARNVLSTLALGIMAGLSYSHAQESPAMPAPLPESTSQHFHTLPPEARSFFDQQNQLSRLQAQRERLDLESQVLRLQMDYKMLQRQHQEERLVEVLTVMHWDGQPHALLMDDRSRSYLVREGTQLPKIGRVERIEGQEVALRDADRPKAAARVLGFRAAPVAAGASTNGLGVGGAPRPPSPPFPVSPAPSSFPAGAPRR